MALFFTPTPAQLAALQTLADGIPEVQRTLVANHPQLSLPDRSVNWLIEPASHHAAHCAIRITVRSSRRA